MCTAGAARDGAALVVVDAAPGAARWQFPAALWKASPMTYMFDRRQHVAVAAGPTILAFGLADEDGCCAPSPLR